MYWNRPVVMGFIALLVGVVSANAQQPNPPAAPSPYPAAPTPYPPAASPSPAAAAPYPVAASPYSEAESAQPAQPTQTIPLDPGPPEASTGLEAESLPAQYSENIVAPLGYRMGPTPAVEENFLMDILGLRGLFGDTGIRTLSWLEGGYTGASSGTGILSVQPRQNRFGNNFLLNQIGFSIQKPLEQDKFNLGFMVRYFAGADAALGAAKGGIGYPPDNPRFGQDFRDLYLSAHFPILTDRGVDFQIGRMNTIIGYNGFLAPYRPFYSSDYQFFYSQDGAFTGFLTTVHASDRLDIWNGMTLGANTFFVNRSAHSYCYIGQVNYWLQEERKTRLTGSVYLGPDAIFAAPGLAGNFVTMVETRLQQNWTDRFTQVVQNNMGWDANTPVGTGAWYGVYLLNLFHMTPKLDLNSRAEWFDDVRGTRTGVATNYEEVTLGVNWHPVKYIEFRPEIRGDFAGAPAFGINSEHRHYSQLSGGISFLLKF